MNQILHLDNAIRTASAEICRLRKEREALIASLSPHQPEDEFTERGRVYRVRRITAHPTQPIATLQCFYRVSDGRWSKGTIPIHITVGTNHDQG